MKWLSNLFGRREERAATPGSRTMNPKNILFSVPTLSDDMPVLDPIDKPPSRSDVVLHEDDWSQLEFFPRTAAGEIRRLLTELKTFEQANRKSSGWKKPYVRKIARTPVISAPEPLKQLEARLGTGAGGAAFITETNAFLGRVHSGFTFDLGGNIQLYGYTQKNDVPVLAASVGPNADNMKLAAAFMKLNKSDGLMLVDWRAQLLLLGVTPDGNIETWKP
jgi:hypothetical protein